MEVFRPLQRKGSSSSTAAALLVLGVVIGAGLVFGTLFASGSLGQRTNTQFITLTQTLTTTLTSSGGYVQSFQVSAQVTQCYHTANGTDNCRVMLTNSGAYSTSVTACTIMISGASTSGRISGPTALAASSSVTVSCSVVGAAQTVGSQAVGSFFLSNGASVPFSGTWS